jgi:hypothetical protein
LKRKIYLAILLIFAVLVGCNNASTNEDVSLKDNEVEQIKEMVSDYSLGKVENESASITSQHLIVKKGDGKEVSYDLPEEEFFVSIAPYMNETHPWTNHSLTGCQGELAEKTFDVTIVDEAGQVILDEEVVSQANGFFDLWLPRDQTYRVKIEHDGKVVESEVSTFEKDGTCITTMQLT